MKRRYLVLLTLAAVALALAAIVGAFYGVENWQGARAWEQARRELAARGESLDPADFIPPPVPDDVNLAMIPLFARALDYRIDLQTEALTFGKIRPDEPLFQELPYGRGEDKPPPAAFGNWMIGQPPQLPALQAYYAG